MPIADGKAKAKGSADASLPAMSGSAFVHEKAAARSESDRCLPPASQDGFAPMSHR